MTTLQSIGAQLMLCLPKLKHYGFFLGLCTLFVLTTAHRPTEFSSDNHVTEKTMSDEVTAMMPQLIYIPATSETDTVTIADCDERNSFESDQSEGVLYADLSVRNSLVVICPPDPSNYLKVSFTHFDLEVGDTLYAFSGRDTLSPLVGKGSGFGNPQMNGGWVGSNCDKALEPTGCLTFQFKTDGDNAKAAGWEAWITCEDGSASITPPDNQFVTLECDELKTPVTITAGDIITDCGIANDSLLVQIFNAKGRLCKDTCLREGDGFVIATLAIGRYRIQHTMKALPSITATNYVIISPPAMTCNDNVEAVFGASCIADMREDYILENPCDTTENLYYTINIMTPDGKTVIKSGTSRGGQYPVVTKDDVQLCGPKYRVEIIRVIDYGGGCCSEGIITDVCWGYVTFVDGTKPQFQGHNIDTLMTCGAVDFAEIGGKLTKPNVIDNCDSVSLEAVDYELISGDECSEVRTYLVYWKAIDICGNYTTQKDTLRVLRPDLSKVIKLPDVILSCGEDNPETMEDYDRLGIVKIPMLGDTLTLSTEEYVCNLIIVKNDEEIPHPGGKKVARNWSIIDACGNIPYPIRVDTQLIEFIDTLPPSIDCSPYNTLEKAQGIALPPDACAMTVNLPKPTATDICAEPTVSMIGVEQLEDGEWTRIANNLGEAGELPCDTFRIFWEAKDITIDDSLALRDTCIQYLRVEDRTPPRVICNDKVQIAYDHLGTRLFASEIDHQSTDACGIVKIEIRKEGGEWAEYLDFFCEDVHKSFPSELRFTDKNGNVNFCSFNVELLDNIPPYCADLPDFNGTCAEFHNGQLGPSTDTNENGFFNEDEWVDLTGALFDEYNNQFGDPQCEDNLACVPFSSEQQYQVIYEQCGVVRARRRYRIIDWNGQGIASEWRYQEININYTPDWSITLPTDFFGECGDNHPEAGLTINNGACDLLGWEHEDQIFEVVPDACYKVVRTYHIINWCNYEQGQDPIELNRAENVFGLVNEERTITAADVANYGYYTYVQVLKIVDNEAPTISINEVQTCIYGVGDADPAGVEDQSPGAAPYECDTIRIFSAEASDCEASDFKNFSFTYEIYEDSVLVGSGEGGKFFWPVRPKVKYRVKYTAFDNCGNMAMAEKEYEFWDCARPTVSCQTGVNVEITEDSIARVDADLLDKGSYDNCTPRELLKYRIWHTSVSAIPPNDKAAVASLPESLFLGCEYQGPQQIYFYVLDQEYNFDVCITSVGVYNNAGICPGEPPAFKAVVAGDISTMDGSMVENVEIEVVGAEEMPTAITGINGDFTMVLDKGHTYQIQATKKDNPLNGVSTFDLILISKHILGIQTIGNPYELIAADVNQSGTITAFDMVQLRQLILNVVTEFPNNDSWRFVDAKYDFTTANPLSEPFTEIINIDNHQGDMDNANFVAIKIGDLNHSAKVNQLQTSESRTTRPTLNLRLTDRAVKAGDHVTIDFQIDELMDLNGYQFALNHAGLELVNIAEGLVKEHHFGKTLQAKSILLNSWDRFSGSETATTDRTSLFSLTFKALATGKLSDFLHLQPNTLQTEAYHENGDFLDIALHFEQQTTTLTLAQNRPNPFRTTTSIDFQLPEAGKATLTILDVQGRVLLQQTNDFSSGRNQWIIEGQSLDSKGILYYQLATDSEVLTKKMMLIE